MNYGFCACLMEEGSNDSDFKTVSHPLAIKHGIPENPSCILKIFPAINLHSPPFIREFPICSHSVHDFFLCFSHISSHRTP